MKRELLTAVILILGAASVQAADSRDFAVSGGSGASAYQGTVHLEPAGSGQEAQFMTVEWTFGSFVVRGYGVVSNDDPSTLTVSYVVPVGLGVGRYRLQPDGSLVGSLVGEKGYFVREVWTTLDGGGLGLSLRPGR